MSKDKIFLIRDGELKEINKKKYEKEKKLQSQVENHVNLIPGDQIDPDNPRRWILIERESGIQDTEEGGNRWSVDHLLLDQDGIPTLVEIKRQQDTRARRKVVAQLLDYAANTTSYWSRETIREKFKTRVENPEEELDRFLGEETTIEKFWENVEENLDRNKIRMLLVADDIPSETKSIVEFLYNQMKPAEVLAVELSHYRGEGEELIVPRIIGQTEKARKKKKSSNRKYWNEEEFWNEIDRTDELSSKEKEVIRDLKDFVKQNNGSLEYRGDKNGSFGAQWNQGIDTKSYFTVRTDGILGLHFLHHLKKHDGGHTISDLEMLIEELNKIDSFDLDKNVLENVYQEYRIDYIIEEGDRELFKEAILNFVHSCDQD